MKLEKGVVVAVFLKSFVPFEENPFGPPRSRVPVPVGVSGADQNHLTAQKSSAIAFSLSR